MAGLLDILKSQWEQGQPYRAAMSGLLQGDIQPAKQALGVGQPWPKNPPNMLSGDAMNNEGVNAALGFAPLGITAWHGSPHKFDKFDMSKIGTGEGAQAYGHGLYFADSPEVAKSYGLVDVGKNRGFKSITYNGETLEVGNGNSNLLFDIVQQGRKPVIDRLEKQASRLDKSYPEMSSKIRDKIAFAKTVNPDKVQINGGNLYKVDIPDSAIPKMLDWDKPLSEQNPDVQAAWNKYLQTKQAKSADKSLGGDLLSGGAQFGDPLGKDIHGAIYEGFASKNGGELPKVQSFLQKQGIPGIRYLDGNSRGTGQGSYNYVIFDDTLPKILERNGQPVGLLGK